MKEVWSSLNALEEKVFELQGKIYDLQNQNCEYELKFLRMGFTAECRILETEVSFENGEPLPWKRFTKDYVINRNKNEECGVEANFDIINDMKSFHKKEMKEVWSSLTALEEKVFELQ